MRRGRTSSTELGLDLSTPEATAREFRDAWAAGRYARAYFLLTPQLQYRLNRGLMLFRLGTILRFPEHEAEVTDWIDTHVAPLMAEHSIEEAASLLSTEAFAQFAALMRAAARTGRLPFEIAADAVLPEARDPGGLREVRRHLGGPDEGSQLTLRRSPAGRWRVEGVERRGGTPPPAAWRPS